MAKAENNKDTIETAMWSAADKLRKNIDAAEYKHVVLGLIFLKYISGHFALAEGKKGGQFYTLESVVRVLVEMLEPFKGRVFDPFCGSGGLFVQSEKFVSAHSGRVNDISIYGQERNQMSENLCRG